MDNEYDLEETIIARIEASFLDELTQDNIKFYRSHVPSPFSYDLEKVGDYYYIIVDLEGKSPNNYTIKVEDAYYYSGGQTTGDDIVKNFTVSENSADFSIDPGFFIASTNFSINIKSLADTTIDVNINPPLEIDSVSSVEVSPGQTETVDFIYYEIIEELESTITLSTTHTSYEVPIVVYETPIIEKCGNGKLDSGEICDGEEWGNVTGCDDFLFDSGILECYEPYTYYECTFDTSGCFNSSSQTDPVCGNDKIESGEQCDGDAFGTIQSCTYFGFDAGKLECINCILSTDNCYNNIDCEDDNDCENDEECVLGECKKKDSCSENSDCEDGYVCYDKECKEKECIGDLECGEFEICDNFICIKKEKECDTDDECKSSEFCDDNGYCISKDVECINDSDCDLGKECQDYECVDKLVCSGPSDCDSGQTCVDGECINANIDKRCTELGGKICATDKVCEGDYQEVGDRICCMEECKAQGGSSTGKLIGWGILILVVVGLVFFYFKYKKTKRKNPDLKKIAKSPLVRGNLVR